VVPGYGHIDCLIGKQVLHDIFPLILDHLEQLSGASVARPAGSRGGGPSGHA
jgi:hypothetical protein